MPRRGYTWNDEYREQFYKSEKVQAHLSEFVAQASLPKSPETREKMRLAKLNKPKTAEHKANMAETHKFRQALKREVIAKNPDLPVKQVWDLVRLEMYDSE